MIDRIQLILKSKNLSSSQFADEIQVQRSSISHILSGRNKPSLDFIMKILSTYSEVNADWLIFGKGQMIQKKKKDTTVLELEIEETKQKEETYQTERINQAPPTPQLKNNPGTNEPIDKILIFYKNGTFQEFNSK